MRIFLFLVLALVSLAKAAEPQLSSTELRAVRNSLERKLEDTVIASLFNERDNPHNMPPRLDPLAFVVYKEVLGGSWTAWNKTLQGELRSFENKTGTLLSNDDGLVMRMRMVYQRLEDASAKDSTLYPRLQKCINDEMPEWKAMGSKKQHEVYASLWQTLEASSIAKAQADKIVANKLAKERADAQAKHWDEVFAQQERNKAAAAKAQAKEAVRQQAAEQVGKVNSLIESIDKPAPKPEAPIVPKRKFKLVEMKDGTSIEARIVTPATVDGIERYVIVPPKGSAVTLDASKVERILEPEVK